MWEWIVLPALILIVMLSMVIAEPTWRGLDSTDDDPELCDLQEIGEQLCGERKAC